MVRPSIHLRPGEARGRAGRGSRRRVGQRLGRPAVVLPMAQRLRATRQRQAHVRQPAHCRRLHTYAARPRIRLIVVIESLTATYCVQMAGLPARPSSPATMTLRRAVVSGPRPRIASTQAGAARPSPPSPQSLTSQCTRAPAGRRGVVSHFARGTTGKPEQANGPGSRMPSRWTASGAIQPVFNTTLNRAPPLIMRS